MEAESWKTVYTSKLQNFEPSIGQSALINNSIIGADEEIGADKLKFQGAMRTVVFVRL